MSDNIPVTPGSGKTVATDEVVDGTLGTVQVQFVKLMDGTLDSTNKLIISAAGAAKVDGSAVTQPVSGTITANIGTAGSLALDATVAALQVSQGSTTSGQKGALTLGAVTTAAPSYTTGQSSPLSLDTSGNLRVTSTPSGTQTVAGNKSNNSAAPGSTNIGTLGAVATAAAPSYTEGNQVGLSTDLSGAVRVTGSLSVGGTTDNSAFTAGTSTGTPAMGFYHSTIDTVTDGRSAAVGITSKRAMLTNLQNSSGVEVGTASAPLQVSLANTGANSTAVKVDGSAVTQPVSAASLPLPTGASTAAKQPALGTAGSASADVITVQGIASMTALKVDGSAVTQPVAGVKTNDNAAPGATNVGTLPAVANAAAPTRTEGNQVALRTSLSGDLAVTLDGEAVVLGAGSASIGKLGSNSGVTIGAVELAAAQTLATVTTLTGTTTLTPGTGATNLGKAEDAVHASGDTGVFMLAVSNEAQSSLAADGDYIAHAVDTKGNTLTVGNVAHDAVDAGNPVKIGGKAVALGTNPTAVAANDRTDLYAIRSGIPFHIGGHPNIVTLEASYTAAQTDTPIVTISTGLKIVVTQVMAIVDAATSVAVNFRIGFGSTNTPTTTGVVLTHPGILALSGSGVSRGDGSSIIGAGGDGEDLRITSSVPTSGSLRVLVSYFTVES